jgi:hypothetical protein
MRKSAIHQFRNVGGIVEHGVENEEDFGAVAFLLDADYRH